MELAELDGPYVKIRLSGRFWHKRSTVLARLGNYLKQRIPVSAARSTLCLLMFVYDPNEIISGLPGNIGGGYRRREAAG